MDLKNKKLFLMIGLILLGIGLLIVSYCAGSQTEPKENAAAAECEEERVLQLLQNTDGIGKTEIYFRYDDAVPCGAVILCENGDDPTVRMKLLDILSTLYPIKSNHIYIGKTRE